MNTFVLLALQESLVQCSAGKHDQWRGYMTVLVVNLGIKESISLLTAVIHLMIKVVLDKLRDCFCQEVQWMLAICYQLATFSALHLCRVHHLPQALLQEQHTYCLPQRNQ
jgi:hypothetical protein